MQSSLVFVMKKHSYKVIAVVVIILLAAIGALQGVIIAKENKAQDLFNSPSWAVDIEKIASAAYDEEENYAGFSSYVDIDEVFKTDLISTYAFSKLLHCVGEEISKLKRDRISSFCLNNIENYMEESPESFTLNKDGLCCEEEWIYINLSLMNKKDINLIKDQIYWKVNRLYKKGEQILAVTDKKEATSKNIAPVLYTYKIFHLLDQFPNNMNEDKLYFLRLFSDNKFFSSLFSEGDSDTTGLVIIQCLEELSVSRNAVSNHTLNSRREWFNKQLDYIEHNIKNPTFAGITMFEVSKIAPFLNEKIVLEDNFVKRICNNELYKGGWATVPGFAICSPIATYSIVCLLEETGNLDRRNNKKAENLLKSIKKLERDNGFSKPYGLIIDPESTYYGLKIWEEIPFPINREKVLSYLSDTALFYIRDISGIIDQLHSLEGEKYSEELEKESGDLAGNALNDTKGLYYTKRSMDLLEDHSLDSKIKTALSKLVNSELFGIGVSFLPPNRLILHEFFCMFELTNEECLTVMDKFQSLGSQYGFGKPFNRYEFYQKYWGEYESSYNILDALPPDRLETPDISYLVSILKQCQDTYNNERTNGIIKFHPGYIVTMERLKKHGGMNIYLKKLVSFRSIIFGGYRRTNKVWLPDMDDTYFAVHTFSILNIHYGRKTIKKFLSFTILHSGGFTFAPFSNMKGDLRSTAEGLELWDLHP